MTVDFTISLWFLATMGDDLQQIVMIDDNTAFDTWRRVHAFFTANKAGRSMHLLQQGDMSIPVYCSKLKSIADALNDVDDPIDNRQLSLRLLDGLSKKFRLQSEIMQCAVPSFEHAQSRLQLAEISLNSRTDAATTHALAILSGGSGTSTDRGDRADRGGGNNGGYHGGGHNGGHRGGYNGGHNGGYNGGHNGGYNGGHNGGGYNNGYNGGRGGRGRGRGSAVTMAVACIISRPRSTTSCPIQAGTARLAPAPLHHQTGVPPSSPQTLAAFSAPVLALIIKPT